MFVPVNAADASALPDPADLVAQFKERGVVLLRGFDLGVEGFIEYTSALTPDFMDYSGGAYAREAIDGNETVLSVTGNRQFFAVPLHGEMFYTKFRPTILWFYCISPPLGGGETTTCDGVAICEHLSPDTLRLFEQQDIKYIRSYDSETWKGIYLTEDPEKAAKICAERDTRFSYDAESDSIRTEFQCSALARPLYTDRPAFVNNILPVCVQEANGNTHSLVRFADESRIPHDVIAEITEVADKLTLPVAWEAGDLIMVDNSRLMHGRHAFNDTQREINVRMSSNTF
jgi:alpha-ketoglutarate-dependent taurine dioxygenase